MTQSTRLPATGHFLHAPSQPDPAEAESPQGEAMDMIFIEGFEGGTVVGINKDEVSLPQTVRIDVAAGRPRLRACETDRIADTIDYGAVHGGLQHLLASHHFRMLEALAQAIADMLIADFGAHWVRVVLAKPRKFDDVAAVGVVIERRATQPAAPAAAATGARAL